MIHSKKAAALATGLAAVLFAPLLNRDLAAQNPKGGTETLVVEEAHVDWIDLAKVASLHEGVVERMELTIGMPVAKGKPIGYLHTEIAELTVKKAEVAAL